MKAHILRFLLMVEAVALLSFAWINSIDYQDQWILAGLEIPFIVFVATYAILFYKERNANWMIIYALLFGLVAILIPNVKYNWFMGVAIDQHIHYSLISNIYSSGFIPAGTTYSDYPAMHLLFAAFSRVAGVSILNAYKFLPAFFWLLYPLVTYSIVKNLGFEKTSIMKYALIISSIPIRPDLSYLVSGTLFGALLTFLILSQLVRIFLRNDAKEWIILLLFTSTLVITHASSSVFLAIVITMIYLVRKKFSPVTLPTLLLIIVMNLSWFDYKAVNLPNDLKGILLRFVNGLVENKIATTPVVSSRFFSLDALSAMKVIVVFYGGDLLLVLLSILGVILLTKKRNVFDSRLRRQLGFMCLYVLINLLIAGAIFLARLQEIGFERTIVSAELVSPVLSGIFLHHTIGQKEHRRILCVLFFSLLFTLAAVEFYQYQPLIPSANNISKDLPLNEPATYINNVNSAYQRYLILHAERYINSGRIACDRVTLDQIIGLTSLNFSRTHLAWYYPFSRLIDNSTSRQGYDYFLIHFPGKGGVILEDARIRTPSLISEAINNSDVVYTNGESYMLTKPFNFLEGSP
jgi:hypothetical protein